MWFPTVLAKKRGLVLHGVRLVLQAGLHVRTSRELHCGHMRHSTSRRFIMWEFVAARMCLPLLHALPQSLCPPCSRHSTTNWPFQPACWLQDAYQNLFTLACCLGALLAFETLSFCGDERWLHPQLATVGVR